MTKYAVDKVLWQIARDTKLEEEFKTNRDSFLTGRDLEENEHAALLQWDIRTLFQGGAHPFLIYMASQRMMGGWSFQFMTDYVALIHDLKLVDIKT
jgi:hypothetical protein